MPGLSDYTATNALNFLTGRSAMPALANRFMALFTAPPSDAGSGGTEVTGGSYARVQVGGALTAGGAFTTSSGTITLASPAPAWLLALGTNGSGVNVFDATTGLQVGTVSSISGSTVTLTANAASNSSGSADSLDFSAWPGASASSGSEPATSPASTNNGAAITFPTATADWGTVNSFGIFDAATSGNMLTFDYLGNFPWLPFTATNASPAVLTSPGSGYANGDKAAVTQKYGGTLPSTGGSWAGVLTVAGVSGDTFNLGVNSTSTGDGNVRKVLQQSIPNGVTASFPASSVPLTAA